MTACLAWPAPYAASVPCYRSLVTVLVLVLVLVLVPHGTC